MASSIIVTSSSSEGVKVYLGDGLGSREKHEILRRRNGPFRPSRLATWTEDGILDLVVVDGEAMPWGVTESAKFSLSRGASVTGRSKTLDQYDTADPSGIYRVLYNRVDRRSHRRRTSRHLHQPRGPAGGGRFRDLRRTTAVCR